MSEETYESYEHECMRAELLGLPKPERKPEHEIRKVVQEDDDEIDAEAAKDLNETKDDLKRVGGGLEELTSILSSTQKKLTSFKTNFGSLKDLFQKHLSTDNGSGGSEAAKSEEDVKDENNEGQEGIPAATKKLEQTTKAANDLGQEMESQVDKLDSILAKAEYAEMTMSSQNKQMRKFLH